MSRKSRKKPESEAPRVPIAEQLLIDALPALQEDRPAGRILCTSLGRGQFAVAAGQGGAASVVCHFLDVYQADQAREAIADCGLRIADLSMTSADSAAPSITVVCAADFPAETLDLAAIPVDPRGEAELTRDLLQAAHDRLQVEGRLMAAVSAPDDQWLHDEMRKLFAKVTRQPMEQGVLYLATKTEPLRKHKIFACEFAFRDRGRLIKAFSRPGVFSHRSLDAGARALINTMELRGGDRVLDLGCGSGVVSLAAAVRAPGVQVVAIDSNARAVECTARGAALNEVTNVSTVLNADGDSGALHSFDLVLGNPPYYSDYRIAEVFLQAAQRALKPGGQVLMVTKTPAWFEQRMTELFDEVATLPHKAYVVVQGMQRDKISERGR